MMVCQIMYLPPYSPMSASKQLDGDFNLIELLDKSCAPEWRPFKGYAALTSGCAVEPEYLPTKIQIPGGVRAITDFDGYRGVLYVSPRFREIIERLEPNVHQFFPIELVNKKRETLASHWIWVPCNRIDSFDREHTTWVLKRGRLWMTPNNFSNDELPLGYDRSQPLRIVFNANQVGDHHFWRDMLLRMDPLYCSDKAADAIAEAELSGIQLLWKETV